LFFFSLYPWLLDNCSPGCKISCDEISVGREKVLLVLKIPRK
jgi:hypothetical protein